MTSPLPARGTPSECDFSALGFFSSLPKAPAQWMALLYFATLFPLRSLLEVWQLLSTPLILYCYSTSPTPAACSVFSLCFLDFKLLYALLGLI